VVVEVVEPAAVRVELVVAVVVVVGSDGPVTAGVGVVDDGAELPAVGTLVVAAVVTVPVAGPVVLVPVVLVVASASTQELAVKVDGSGMSTVSVPASAPATESASKHLASICGSELVSD
jgi:hypothetical protein